MNFYFHPEAEKEFYQAIEYYEERREGLGIDFAEEVYAAVFRAIQFPSAWIRISPRTRRCFVNRFPYGIIFQLSDNALRLLAVAHLHRRPGYWKSRL